MAGIAYEASSAFPGEKTIQRAFIHWMVYAPAFLFAGLAYLARGLWPALLFFAALSAVAAIFALIQVMTTEIVITNKRAFCKTGLVLRKTEEIAVHKIEGVYINQSVLGRLFNYGDITIRGTGTGTITVSMISDPLDLRRAAQPF